MRRSLLLLCLCAAVLGSLSASAAAAVTSSIVQVGQGGSHWSALFSAWSSGFTASNAWTSSFRGSASFSSGLTEDARAALPWMAADAVAPSSVRGNTSYIVTDLALTEAETSALSNGNGDLGSVWHLPVALTACSLIYNLPGVSFNLTLDGPTLAGILTGTIQTWDAPALVALNPAIASEPTLAGVEIEAVVRGESSTTSWHLTDYLTRTADSVWTQGRTQSPAFGVDLTRKDDGGALAAYVAATPYTLGYAKKRTAARAGPGAREAFMLNAAGVAVYPSTQAIQAAAAALRFPMPAPSSLHDGVYPGASLAEGAYPLAQFAWMVTFAQYTVNASSLPAFVEYISSDPAQAASVVPAFYVPLPAPLRVRNIQAAAAMTQRGSSEFPDLPAGWSRNDGHVLGVVLGLVLALGIVFGTCICCLVRTGVWDRWFYKPEAAARRNGEGAVRSDEMEDDADASSPQPLESEMAVRPALHTIGGFSDLGGDGAGTEAEMLDASHAVRITLAHDQLAGDLEAEDEEEDEGGLSRHH